MFLVTQELLPEAHENQKDGRRWNINVWLFIGVVGVLLLHSFLPEEDDPTGECRAGLLRSVRTDSSRKFIPRLRWALSEHGGPF